MTFEMYNNYFNSICVIFMAWPRPHTLTTSLMSLQFCKARSFGTMVSLSSLVAS